MLRGGLEVNGWLFVNGWVCVSVYRLGCRWWVSCLCTHAHGAGQLCRELPAATTGVRGVGLCCGQARLRSARSTHWLTG
jgi:hypothetical protein